MSNPQAEDNKADAVRWKAPCGVTESKIPFTQRVNLSFTHKSFGLNNISHFSFDYVTDLGVRKIVIHT